MHPTVKPVQLVADAIKDVCPRGAIVLDLFGGSGSTLIASHKIGRRAHVCEYDPLFCDRIIRRWDAVTGEPIGNVVMGAPEDPLADFAGDHGAEMFRACIACHTLRADEGVRAGPTLAGIFGRRIATLPGYNFSDALKRLDIVWTPETVAKLFEVGPMAYTPGTKMPEQRIGSVEDRAALVQFLEKATKKD